MITLYKHYESSPKTTTMTTMAKRRRRKPRKMRLTTVRSEQAPNVLSVLGAVNENTGAASSACSWRQQNQQQQSSSWHNKISSNKGKRCYCEVCCYATIAVVAHVIVASEYIGAVLLQYRAMILWTW
jgi:hypothetical protein